MNGSILGSTMPFMKKAFTYFWMAVLIAMISACVASPPYAPGSRIGPPDAESVLFQQAEQSLTLEDRQQALAGFSQYLSRYPQGRYADRAFNHIGDIYYQLGEYDAAQAFYQRLVADFPHSPLLNGARLAIVNLLILNHQPAEAMAQAKQMLDSNPDDETRHKLWQLLASQSGEAGTSANAAAYAYMLYKSAPGSEKDA